MRRELTVLVWCGLVGMGMGMGCSTPSQPSPDAGAVEGGPLAPPAAPSPEEELERAAQEQLKQDLAAFTQAHPGLLDARQQAALDGCQGQACVEVAEAAGFPSTLGSAHRVPLWFKACAGGSGEGCAQLGASYGASMIFEPPSPHLLDRDVLSAKHLFYRDRACRLDEAQCLLWALLATSTEAHREEGLKKLDALCAGGAAEACVMQGELFEEGEGYKGSTVARDLSAARAAYLRACKLAAPEPKVTLPACLKAGNMLLLGRGGPAQEAEALALLEPRCAPDTPEWRAACKGEPAPFTEQCSAEWRGLRQEQCFPLAERWLASGDAGRVAAADRMFSVVCIKGTKNARATLEACNRWGEHLIGRGAAEPIPTYVAKIRCRLEADVCFSEAKSDEARSACDLQTQRCFEGLK